MAVLLLAGTIPEAGKQLAPGCWADSDLGCETEGFRHVGQVPFEGGVDVRIDKQPPHFQRSSSIFAKSVVALSKAELSFSDQPPASFSSSWLRCFLGLLLRPKASCRVVSTRVLRLVELAFAFASSVFSAFRLYCAV